MTSYRQKLKRNRAKQLRQKWQKKIQDRITEFYHKPKWWRKIKSLDKLYQSLEVKSD